MAETRQAERPLSPHLQIYRFTITMAMSIIHRITGAGLYVGTLLLAAWLLSVAMGPDAYASFQSVAGSWIGQLILFGFTWALIHHLFSGIRYLMWDNIRAFDNRTADIISWIAAVAAFAAAIIVWIVAFKLRGVL
ncbi:succinate dehydrogenase, cytochrome b556 subunit [Parvibaculum sp.]|uniref:succinate dehydrogenase, cytochrome b556 subunit n=1 Tax=Parvibaculum sp. TaxID=2024848 RepID=UPI00320F6FC4